MGMTVVSLMYVAHGWQWYIQHCVGPRCVLLPSSCEITNNQSTIETNPRERRATTRGEY